jgi:oligopeptide/dipeptide ABC transporter ATP-binding protein
MALPDMADATAQATTDDMVLEVKELRTYFFTRRGVGKAVDGVSFMLRRGETLGIVGESGSGKSMTALSILRLNPTPASRITAGQIFFRGEDLVLLTEAEMRRYRGSRISMVLQDPATALDPVFTVGYQLEEPLKRHQRLQGAALKTKAVEMLRLLRIPSPELRIGDYPHQMSGGMRQRSVGAIALSCDPELLIADEPTTALDVTTQLAYLQVLKDIQRTRRLALLFITHDLSIVARVCDRVAVMYAGRIVESGEVSEIFDHPMHPYTEGLLNSVLDFATARLRLHTIEGQPPSIYEIPSGCPFAPRCAYVMDRCRQEQPPELLVGDGHVASCWRHA